MEHAKIMSQAIEAAVLAAEQRRCAAMLQNSADALEPLLDPRLHFSHATGVVDDKPTLLAKIASGRILYTGIAWSEDRVIELADNAAILAGRMTTDVTVEGTEKRLNNRVITVWTKSGEDWLLTAFQSTPLPA